MADRDYDIENWEIGDHLAESVRLMKTFPISDDPAQVEMDRADNMRVAQLHATFALFLKGGRVGSTLADWIEHRSRDDS